MKPKIDLIIQGLKYWFLNSENIDLIWTKKTRHWSDIDLYSIFEEGIDDIIDLSKRTGKKIYLALSWWVDSVIIYKLLNRSNVDFTSINISFWDKYTEISKIKELLWNDKINYIIENDNDWLNILDKTEFKYFVSHPTIKAYYYLIKNIPDNSILVTWDLWDECFKYDSCYLEWGFIKNSVFEDHEIAMITWFEGRWKNISYKFCNFVEEDVFFYENVTLKSIHNVISSQWKSNLIYYPFYKNFLQYSNYIADKGLKNDNKSFLINYSRTLWLNFDQNYKTIWFKYKKNENIIHEYLEYVISNKDILIKYGINIGNEFLEYISKNIIDNRWKIFTLVVFIILFKKSDNRFFRSKK